MLRGCLRARSSRARTFTTAPPRLSLTMHKLTVTFLMLCSCSPPSVRDSELVAKLQRRRHLGPSSFGGPHASCRSLQWRKSSQTLFWPRRPLLLDSWASCCCAALRSSSRHSRAASGAIVSGALTARAIGGHWSVVQVATHPTSPLYSLYELPEITSVDCEHTKTQHPCREEETSWVAISMCGATLSRDRARRRKQHTHDQSSAL